MKRWTVQLRGLGSGEVTRMDFLRFRSREETERWIEKAHRGSHYPLLTRWEPLQLESPWRHLLAGFLRRQP